MTLEPPTTPEVDERGADRTPWSGGDIVLVFVIGIIGAIFLGLLLYPLLDKIDLTQTTIETIFTLLTYASIAAVGLTLVFKRHRSRPSDVGLTPVPASTLLLMIPAAFAVMMVNGFLVLLMRELFGDVATVEDQLNVVGETLDRVEIAFFFLTTTIAAPLVEEFVFRGMVYRYLRGRTGIPWAMVISAALFSALHFIPKLIPPLFFLGLALAYVSQRYNSILPAMVMHCVVNLTAVTLLVVEYT